MKTNRSTITLAIDFGAQEVRPIIDTLKKLLKTEYFNVHILHTEQEKKLEYFHSKLSLEDATEGLASDQLSSILLLPPDDSSRFHAMVFRPNFLGDGLPCWNGAIELRTLYKRSFIEQAVRVPGLHYIALSLEDSVEFMENERVTKENFPWDDWRLIEAVVGDGSPLSLNGVQQGAAAAKVLK